MAEKSFAVFAKWLVGIFGAVAISAIFASGVFYWQVRANVIKDETEHTVLFQNSKSNLQAINDTRSEVVGLKSQLSAMEKTLKEIRDEQRELVQMHMKP